MGVTIAVPDLAIRLPTIKECVLLLTCYVVSRAIHYFIVKPLTSPLRKLQRPPEGKGFLGHWPDMMDYYNGTTIDKWVQDYGPTFMVRGPYYVHHRLFTMDARAVSHIMANPYSYEKPWILRQVLKRYMSEGLVVAEGHRHKVQRKIVQRLFSRNTMRQMNEVVVEKANQFRDVFTDLINSSEPTHPIISHHAAPKDGIVVDMYSAASRVTYDIIGQVAIDHTFDTLGQPHGEGGELFEKYEKMQQMVPGSGGYRQEIGVVLPWIDKIAPTENSRRVDAAMGPLEALSRAKIAERRKEVAEGKRSDARDLLSLMVRANMSTDVAPDWKMYDSEISGQLATFVFAGSDTTAGAIAWGLFALARHPEVQQQLRTECLSYGENLPFEQMDELPFLDATVKEILRMNPSFPNTIRIARKDDIIPLTTPIVDVDGKTLNEVRIRKGQIIHLPIEDLNMGASLWGPDAREFRPSRWLDLSKSHTSTTKDPNDMKNTTSFNSDSNAGPGVWPNIMTFIDGPRRCVGYKLALMECKILLFTLVRSFTFEPVEGVRIGKWNLFSTRPYVVGELATTGTSLPLVVKAYKG